MEKPPSLIVLARGHEKETRGAREEDFLGRLRPRPRPDPQDNKDVPTKAARYVDVIVIVVGSGSGSVGRAALIPISSLCVIRAMNATFRERCKTFGTGILLHGMRYVITLKLSR